MALSFQRHLRHGQHIRIIINYKNFGTDHGPVPVERNSQIGAGRNLSKALKSLVFQARGHSRLNRLNLIRCRPNLAKLLKNNGISFFVCARETSLARCTNESASLHQRCHLAPQTSPLAPSTCIVHAEDTIAESVLSDANNGIANLAAISCMPCDHFTGRPRWKNDSFPWEGAVARHIAKVCAVGTLAQPTRIGRTVAMRLA